MTETREGGTLLDKYRMERRLGAGGVGTLWLAFDVRLRRRVVIKFLHGFAASDPLMNVRFEREARASARIRSPHVIETYDYGVDRGTAFIVMEYLEGEDLGCRLERVKRLSPAQAAPIAAQMGKALDAVHGAGFVHRDLKPGNVFLAISGDDELVKVLDFGYARPTSQAVGKVTKTGVVVGTPRYISPEQARGAKTIDHRTDLWSMGVILYRALTGQCPFSGTNVLQLIDRICEGSYPRASEVSPDLPAGVDAFFARAFAVEPSARFQSGKEFSNAFLSALGEQAPTSTPTLSLRGSGADLSMSSEQAKALLSGPASVPGVEQDGGGAPEGGGAPPEPRRDGAAPPPRRFGRVVALAVIAAAVTAVVWTGLAHGGGGSRAAPAAPIAEESAAR